MHCLNLIIHFIIFYRQIHYPPESTSILLLARIVSLVEQAEDKDLVVSTFNEVSFYCATYSRLRYAKSKFNFSVVDTFVKELNPIIINLRVELKFYSL